MFRRLGSPFFLSRDLLMQGSEPGSLSERSQPEPAMVPNQRTGSGDSPTVRSGGSSWREQEGFLGPLPLAGAKIGDFILEEAIGIGGMGAVFRARDRQLDRPVALKILPPEQTHDPE